MLRIEHFVEMHVENSSVKNIKPYRRSGNTDIGYNTDTTHLNIDIGIKASRVNAVYPSILRVGSSNIFLIHGISAAIRKTELPLIFAWVTIFLYFVFSNTICRLLLSAAQL